MLAVERATTGRCINSIALAKRETSGSKGIHVEWYPKGGGGCLGCSHNPAAHTRQPQAHKTAPGHVQLTPKCPDTRATADPAKLFAVNVEIRNLEVCHEVGVGGVWGMTNFDMQRPAPDHSTDSSLGSPSPIHCNDRSACSSSESSVDTWIGE